MMKAMTSYDRAVSLVSARLPEGLALLLLRVALAGVFWRSGQTKVVEGSWFRINPDTYDLFRTEFSGLPLDPSIAVPLTSFAEHVFPMLLLLGLATRFSAGALLVMTLVIQIFVFPGAWWPVHSLWAAMAAVLIVRGGGVLSLDALALKLRGR